jgi:uncharacterized protein YbaR (Trm112 family)
VRTPVEAEFAQARAVASSKRDVGDGPTMVIRLRGIVGDRYAVVSATGWHWAGCGEDVLCCPACRHYTCGCDLTYNEAHESCRELLEEMAERKRREESKIAEAAERRVIHDWQYTDWAALAGKLGAQRGHSAKRRPGKKL